MGDLGESNSAIVDEVKKIMKVGCDLVILWIYIPPLSIIFALNPSFFP